MNDSEAVQLLELLSKYFDNYGCDSTLTIYEMAHDLATSVGNLDASERRIVETCCAALDVRPGWGKH